jgi:hypothetical protein
MGAALSSHAQREDSKIDLFNSIIKYQGQALRPMKTDRCAIRQDGSASEFTKGYCKTTSCLESKKHMAGHCNCPGISSRLVNGQYYTLLNPCEHILLYKKPVNLNKWTSFEYYFGTADGTFMRLTKSNLKKAFPDNGEFHVKLDALFRNNSDLIKFDRLYNMYLLNWVYTHVNRERLAHAFAQ